MSRPQSDRQTRHIRIEEANYIDNFKALCSRSFHALCRVRPHPRPAEGERYSNFWRICLFLVLFLVVQPIGFSCAQYAVRQITCVRTTPRWLTKFVCEVHDLPTHETLMADQPTWFKKIYQPALVEQLDPADKLSEHHTRLMLWRSVARPLVDDVEYYREQWAELIPTEMRNVSEALRKSSLQNERVILCD